MTYVTYTEDRNWASPLCVSTMPSKVFSVQIGWNQAHY